MLRFRIVLWVIFYSIRFGTNPYRYFQINAPWFNKEKNIFSKLDIDTHIPERWRLPQAAVTDQYSPSSFPIFLKPEWGQNSHGIHRIDSIADWETNKEIWNSSFSYIAQHAAPGQCEYEVFYVRDAESREDFATLSISKAENNSGLRYPINSIRNPETTYKHCTEEFNETELAQLWSMIGSIGPFNIARACCRADSNADLLAGDFDIVEINLFVPMPLLLLDDTIEWQSKKKFVQSMGRQLALLIKNIPKNQPYYEIFFGKWALHRKIVKWNESKS